MAYTDIDKSDDYFNTLIYTGDGVGGRALDVGFATDLFWVKHRNGANVHYLTDRVRGPLKGLQSNSTDAEETFDSVRSFTSTGVTVGTSATTNNSGGNTFVAWNWLANGTASSNTDGSITSSVSANQDAGFSIVSYTGTGSNATVGHGLGVAPAMVITKTRNAVQPWRVYHKGLGATFGMILNDTSAKDDDNTAWNDTEPTSSVFSVGTSANTNGSGSTFIAYCFAEKQGYSKFGSYVGNGNADGAFVYTGFKPAFCIIKRTDSAGYSWATYDSTRYPENKSTIPALWSNASDAEGSYSTIDFLSNGLKIRDTSATINESGGSYIYMAFAENPFVTSTGIPTTAR
jgi:hypothetical protein